MAVGSFTSALTRMLLAGDGSTTLLLQALTGGPISARLQDLADRRADRVPADVRTLLQLADGATVAVRRSVLLNHHGMPVSRNKVIVSLGVPLMRRIAADPARPLGLALIAHDIEHGRRQCSSGLARWSAHQRDAASKAYLIHAATTPLMLVWETFNPDIVPPGVKT
ncbi:chorismate pyruvate-lyase family protein [Nonomuraea sp. B12E4]|uniref:chorismate pyruvate-lyase family protein n=1 Tax=Nonomuraea sp. B12E4 TaxID=3153564 RepID=UPI00325C79E5